MKTLRNFLLISCSFALYSCFSGRTVYAPSHPITNAFGQTEYYYGYSEVPLDSTSYQVTFTGDSPDGNDRYSLYSAAELTDSRGFDYFIVTNPGMSDTKTIRMRKGCTPSEPNAYNAKSMLATMGPTFNQK